VRQRPTRHHTHTHPHTHTTTPTHHHPHTTATRIAAFAALSKYQPQQDSADPSRGRRAQTTKERESVAACCKLTYHLVVVVRGCR
jgi:hypothetical protein